MLKGKIKEKSDRTIWAEFKHGWQIKLRYVTQSEMNDLFREASVREWDVLKGVEKARFDEKKYAALLAERVLKDWRGLTPDALRKIVDMESYPDAEVPYSVDDAVELLLTAHEFGTWVAKLVHDMEIFDAARRAEETKNS